MSTAGAIGDVASAAGRNASIGVKITNPPNIKLPAQPSPALAAIKRNKASIAAGGVGVAGVIAATSIFTNDKKKKEERETCENECSSGNTSYQPNCGAHFAVLNAEGVVTKPATEPALSECCIALCKNNHPVAADSILEDVASLGDAILGTGLGSIGWLASNISNVIIIGVLSCIVVFFMYLAYVAFGGGSSSNRPPQGYYPPPPGYGGYPYPPQRGYW